MKKITLLIVIYLAFISLGLPDSLLGAAWPEMYQGLAVPVFYAGIISMIIAGGTVVSSFFSSRIIKRFGVPAATTLSVFITALALLGFSYSSHFIFLCLLAIPLGLGAGCVDAALNNYVALHYQARHMNWLHSFWGIGAAIGPVIMSGYLAQGKSWTSGYNTIAWIQLSLVLILIISIPIWIIDRKGPDSNDPSEKDHSLRTVLKIPGLKQALVVFFCYCSIEATFGLWGASYLVFVKDFTPEEAAKLVSLYYAGITFGRFASGFMTAKFSNRQLVYLGQSLIIAGLIVLAIPFRSTLAPAFFLIGLGCAPVFPSLLHETPRNFGEQHSQKIMGLQMACAYIGITFVPLLFGRLTDWFSYSSLTWFIGVLLLIKIFMVYELNRKTDSAKRLNQLKV
ncbi:MFS transporter [Pollutibacter soli]|uniref:MFS transporter n=1 Tax=Pollutibacter soli TaxID=3034157 RepID=UPI00301372AD